MAPNLVNNVSFISVHPCNKPDRAGCEQTCSKKGEEAVCECEVPAFKLAVDGKTCDEGKFLQLKIYHFWYHFTITKPSIHQGWLSLS